MCHLERYDVVLVGGVIAGSVAAHIGAEQGLKILLLEKYPAASALFVLDRLAHIIVPTTGSGKIQRNRVCI